jgi:hypothetical protein
MNQSIKQKRKPEPIYLRVIKGGLSPADSYAESQLRAKNFKIGDIIKADIRKLRNQKFNRLVHRIGQLCAANIEAFSGLDAHTCIKRLQIEGKIACREIGVMVHGYGMVIQFIPRSMSFDSMDETEYHDCSKRICRLISERYWPNLGPEQIEQMAGVMIDD